MTTRLQDSFHNPRTARPSAGAAVVSRDAVALGEVAGIEGIYFQVAHGSEGTFWLSTDEVLRCDGSVVSLAVTAAELDQHRRSRPGGESWEPPALDALEDALLSESEQLRQREQMERELQEQSRHLPRV